MDQASWFKTGALQALIIAIVFVSAIFIVRHFVISGNNSNNNNSEIKNSFEIQNSKLKIDNSLPAITLKDYAGNTVNLQNFAGKPLVINAWASWCPFCVDELPDLDILAQEFGDDVTIIAINRQENLATAKRFSDELNISKSLVLLLDSSDSFYKSIGAFTMPETIFVNANGSLNFHKRGVMKIDEIRERIKNLL